MGNKNEECINTIIKTTSVCNANSVGDGLAGRSVTVGVVEVGGVSQPGADAERYRCVFTVHTGAGWAW